MFRTQVYLTAEEKKSLGELAITSGKSQSELIREAVDMMIQNREPEAKRRALMEGCGIWKDRDDLPDFREIRRSMDRI